MTLSSSLCEPTRLAKQAQFGIETQVHPAALPVERLLAECSTERTRRGGPGGQHRNKVESAIVITHVPTGVTGQASERRSQHANCEVATTRLRQNLAVQFRSETDALNSPSELWQSKTRGGRIAIGDRHADFPAILAEALDYVAAENFEVGAAAKRLDISTSQLIKLLQKHRPAFDYVNKERVAREMRRLKA